MTAETEFELRKNSLVQSGRRKPVELVAAFLLAVSQINKREGRDANVIGASWQCALVADQLELSIDLLARILVEFEKRGLIESCPSGDLRLKDLATLEGLAAEPVTSSLLRDISDRPKRCSCTLAQGQALLGKSAEAPDIYVVESGILLVEGPASPSSAHQPRILSDGDVFSLDEGGTHVASCEALTDAVVICVDERAPDRSRRSVGRNTLMSASDTKQGSATPARIFSPTTTADRATGDRLRHADHSLVVSLT